MSNSDEFGYKSVAVPAGAVFVAAGETLLIFPSLAAAHGSLTAVDVLEWVEPAAFGPNGEPHWVRCETDRVIIERTGEPARPDELKMLLLRHLEACEDPADATQPLAEIVAIAWSIERNFRLRCDPQGNRIGTAVSVWSIVGIVLTLGAIWYFGFR